MSYFLAVLSIWSLWQVVEVWLALPRWALLAYCLAAGLAVKLALDGWHDWWLGLGLGGAAVLLYGLADLLLMATDALKSTVLRNSRGR